MWSNSIIASRSMKRCGAGSNLRLPRKNFRNCLCPQKLTSSDSANSPARRFPSSASAPSAPRRSFFNDASKCQIRPAAHRDHYGWERSLGQSPRPAPDQGSRGRSAGPREWGQGCAELKVEYLTLYAFSAENWQRPKSEVFALMKLLEKFLKEKTPEL